MDSERDRSVERLLRQSLGGIPVSGVVGPCLDAETLAAWMEGGLTASELAAAQAHAAVCSRCQAAIAALANHEPVVPVPEPRWWRNWWFGWLVPLTGTAAAIALWFAVPLNHGAVSAPTQIETGAPAPQTLQDSRASAQPQAPPAANEERRTAAAAPPARNEEAKREASNAGRRDDKEVALKAPAAEANPTDESRRSLDAVGRLGVQKSAATPQSTGAAEPAAANQALLSARNRVGAGVVAEIVSPDPSSRWRIGASGLIQYSANNGASWETLSSGVSTDLTAGTAPSKSVCWVVGRGGAVLLTIDGRRWRRLAFPQAVDLMAVEAVDDRAATVTAADGRKFRTADAGSSWN